MRICEESSITYSIEDIIDQINNELGFSVVKTSDTTGYILLGNQIKLLINFDEIVSVKLKFPTAVIDISEGTSQVELYSTALDSSTEVYDIIKRMTGEDRNEEDS